jgi:uncharacterized protein (DUF1499 family)
MGFVVVILIFIHEVGAVVGDWDLGVNRRRVEQIRLALRDLNI